MTNTGWTDFTLLCSGHPLPKGPVYEVELKGPKSELQVLAPSPAYLPSLLWGIEGST